MVLEVVPSLRSDVKAILRADKQWCVQPSRKMVDELAAIVREENLLLRPKAGNGNGNRRGGYNKFANNNGPRGLNGVASAAVTRFN